jgi:hypothetical protein
VIPITNPSFETSASDLSPWVRGGSSAGVWSPGTPTTFFNDATPDGTRVAFASGQTDIHQTLSVSLAANTVYTLTFSVGNRKDSGNGIATGNPVYAALWGTTQVGNNQFITTPALGSWKEYSLMWTTGASVAGNVLIMLGETATTGQVSFDKIALDATPVPEPVNIALAIFGGVFGVVILARSRPVRNRMHCWRAAAVHWVDAV